MGAPTQELIERFSNSINLNDRATVRKMLDPNVVFDWTRSIAPYRDAVRGTDGVLGLLADFHDTWEDWHWTLEATEELPDGRMVIQTRVRARGRGSGLEIDSRGAQIVAVRDDLVTASTLFQTYEDALAFVEREERAERLRQARLYFVCEGRPGDGDPEPLLRAALEGGVDLIQLREKAPRCAEELIALSEPFRRAADDHGALFFLNDHPELVGDCRADGVHVGQDDTPVAEARNQAGMAALIGLSTHSPAQFDAAIAELGDERPDQLSAGPVWETPTKPGRPAAGIGLIRHAASASTDVPWFAIGGIDLANVGEVRDAGAQRVVVVRAIRDATDPERAARDLRDALDAKVSG